jgi:hypothetical protein
MWRKIMTDNWLLPFAGRNGSEAWDINFVWKKDNIYIMDNHRAALWCWLQEISPLDKYMLLHIDRHYDTANDAGHLPSLKLEHLFSITLEQYLSISYPSSPPGEKYPLFRDDNYMWPLFPVDGSPITEFIFATHNDESPPDFEGWHEIAPCALLKLCSEFKYSEHEWIVNIDLDYFFHDFFRQNEPIYIRLFSDQYIERVFSSIRYHYQQGKIAVLTIALSPEFCGGWNNAEQICSMVCEIMDIPFNLPECCTQSAD